MCPACMAVSNFLFFPSTSTFIKILIIDKRLRLPHRANGETAFKRQYSSSHLVWCARPGVTRTRLVLIPVALLQLAWQFPGTTPTDLLCSCQWLSNVYNIRNK
jgi:hypothetical protein